MGKGQQNRPIWFKWMKKLMVKRYPRPQFIYLGKPFEHSAIIISNHEGTDAPMSFELWCDAPVRFWGASEMNSGVVSLYKYQTRVYYHEKKHWNLHLARLFCLIASPLTNLFYRGLNLISTYRDTRFRTTLHESMDAIEQGENIVIFPEDSKNGYLPELEGFFHGFLILAKASYRRGRDLPIYVTYFKKDTCQYVIDAPVYFSELLARGETREEIVARLLARCNELGKMQFEKGEDLFIEETKQEATKVV